MAEPQATVAFRPAEDASTSGRLGPLALYFPSGYQPSDSDRCTWELQSKSGTLEDHYIIGRTQEIDLVGHTRSGSSLQLPCRYAIGVLNRAEGTLQYSELEGGRIVRVEPRARALNYAATDAGIIKEDEDRAARVAKSRRLVEAFGSTRRKRQLNVRDNAKVDSEAVGGSDEVKKMLQSIGETASAKKTTREEIMSKIQGTRMLPTHHPEATRPQDAYKLEELVPASAWGFLDTDELVRAVKDRVFRKTELMESGRVHPYVLGRLDSIQNPESVAGQQALKAAAYLSVLLRMHEGPPSLRTKISRGGLRAEAEKKHMNTEVLTSVVSHFYDHHEEHDGSTYLRSDPQKTLMLLHILVIALLLERCSLANVQADALRGCLKLTPAQLSSMYRELGCVVKLAGPAKAKTLQVALLPPTQPPKPLKDYFPLIKAAAGKRQKK